MPFKCRHRIPKQERRLTDWLTYEASLRQRGDLTVWFSEEAIAAWRAEPRGRAWWGNSEANWRCGIEIDHQLEFGRMPH
jgi:hypothetical protein